MTEEVKKPKLEIVSGEEMSIPKPGKFDLGMFKTGGESSAANVGTLLSALPHHNIAAAKDFVRLHPNEDTHWSDELFFVNVPIKGQKQNTLHLIAKDIALKYVPSGRRLCFRLAVAVKPDGQPFLCHVPTRNPDNSWNLSNLQACEQAKTVWVSASSRKDEGLESYKVDYARDPDAFQNPKWPSQSLDELILVTFTGRMIDREDHPALLRLIGAKQEIS